MGAATSAGAATPVAESEMSGWKKLAIATGDVFVLFAACSEIARIETAD